MAIEGKKIISRMTGAPGYIDRIEKGKLYISFQSMNSIGIDLKGYEDKIVVDEETKNELDEIIQSFKVPSRKTNRSKVDNGKMEILPKSIDILDILLPSSVSSLKDSYTSRIGLSFPRQSNRISSSNFLGFR